MSRKPRCEEELRVVVNGKEYIGRRVVESVDKRKSWDKQTIYYADMREEDAELIMPGREEKMLAKARLILGELAKRHILR